MLILEMLIPCRKDKHSVSVRRKFNNLVIVVLNTLILRFSLPIAAVSVAMWASANNIGLLSAFGISEWLKVIIALLVLDFAIYLQHVLFHYIPVLWRIHRTHHADMGFDVTTGLRFHPIEIMLSMLIKFAVIILIGAPVLAVIIFEIVLNATAMFNHSNIKLNKAFDRLLRIFVVTPDMHRVHHSTIARETNSNFGFNLPIWDKLFRTYIAQPRKAHTDMDIGLDNFKDRKQTQNILGILKIPFVETKRK